MESPHSSRVNLFISSPNILITVFKGVALLETLLTYWVSLSVGVMFFNALIIFNVSHDN